MWDHKIYVLPWEAGAAGAEGGRPPPHLQTQPLCCSSIPMGKRGGRRPCMCTPASPAPGAPGDAGGHEVQPQHWGGRKPHGSSLPGQEHKEGRQQHSAPRIATAGVLGAEPWLAVPCLHYQKPMCITYRHGPKLLDTSVSSYTNGQSGPWSSPTSVTGVSLHYVCTCKNEGFTYKDIFYSLMVFKPAINYVKRLLNFTILATLTCLWPKLIVSNTVAKPWGSYSKFHKCF